MAFQSAVIFSIAVVAFALIARQQARTCGARLSFRARSAIVFGLLGVATAAYTGCGALTFAPLPAILAAYVGVSAVTDLQTGFVFDAVALVCAVAVCTIAAPATGLISVASGAAIAGGSLLLVYALSGGRGIGLGDVKLAAVLGAACGAREGAVIVGAAFVLGACVVTPALALGRISRRSAVPFAPFLAISTLGVLCIARGSV